MTEKGKEKKKKEEKKGKKSVGFDLQSFREKKERRRGHYRQDATEVFLRREKKGRREKKERGF